MDFLAFILWLLLAAIAVTALVKSANVSDRMRRIEGRFEAMERRLAAAPSAAAAAPPEPEPELAPSIEEVPERFREVPLAPETAAAEPGRPEQAPPSPPRPPSAAPAYEPSLEERFGTRWVVWVGGFAVALGGFFLVKFSIEAGLLGPGVRIFLGAMLAAGLIAGGEWLRRKEIASGIAGKPSANIPSILTAAGTSVAYAVVWAAYELYGFLSPASAFVLLGVVALATLAAALLHGPWVAALGLVGAYVSPILVSTDKPNFWALYLYLAIVSAAAFALARIRLWRWLAFTAVGFGFFWMMPEIDSLKTDVLSAHAFHATAGFVLIAAMIVSGLFYGPPAEPGKIDWVSAGAIGIYLFAAALFVLATRHDALALTVFTALTAATVAIAWRAESAAGAVPAAAALAVIVIMRWAFDADLTRTIALPGPADAPQPLRAGVSTHLILGGCYAALFAGAGFLAQGRSSSAQIATLWSASAVAAPIAILIGLYGRITHFERSIPFALIALALAALFAYATEQLNKREPRPGIAAAGALFATGAVAALALAFTFAMEKGWLTIALALMVPGVAWIAEKRPLPMLRWLAAALVLLVVLRVGWEPRIVGDDVGLTPIFNWLLYGYGIPAAAFWYAGHLMRRRADDHPSRAVESGAILFSVLLVVLEVRHFMNDGDVYRASGRLSELAVQVCAFLAMTIGLEHVRKRTNSVVHNVGALVIAGLSLFLIVFGLGVGANPMLTGESIGGIFFNLVLLGYGLPAVLTIVLARSVRGLRPDGYRTCAETVALVLALFYFSLEVRTIYHGPVLTIGPTSNAEQYTYSVVWLAFGVVLLMAGLVLGSRQARLASAAIVALTVAKVGLVDTWDLTGIYRALSIICLGLVLLGIGLLYQRVLFPQRAAPAASGSQPSS